MHGPLLRHEVQVLKKNAFPIAKICETTGVSRRTVQRILKEPLIEDLKAAAPGARRVGRPPKVERFRKLVEEQLKAQPDLPTVEVLHRARQGGYEGGKSALYALVAKIRPKDQTPMVRFEGLPGEFSQHDFGQVEVSYDDGQKERLHFFASRLKYSRWVEVRLVPDERVEALVRALLSSFEAWGGMPLVGVFDNPKTVVVSRRGETIEWNKTFGQVVLDYRFAPELCTPRRPNQKGSVENLVGWVKGSFFKVRRFLDRADLQDQLRLWHVEVNTERPSRATGEIPSTRMEHEKERLRALPIPAADYALRFPVVVGPTATVVHEKVSYSMPPESIGFPATLYLYLDRVRIVARKYEAVHPRTPGGGRQQSFLPEHRSKVLASVSGERARLYFKRQQLLELGPVAEEFLTEVVHRRPTTWRGDVERLFDLLQEHGPERLTAALEIAAKRRLFAAHHVDQIVRGAA